MTVDGHAALGAMCYPRHRTSRIAGYGGNTLKGFSANVNLLVMTKYGHTSGAKIEALAYVLERDRYELGSRAATQ